MGQAADHRTVRKKFVCQPLLCSPSNTNFFEIFSSSLNTRLIVDKHCRDVCCGEFPVP